MSIEIKLTQTQAKQLSEGLVALDYAEDGSVSAGTPNALPKSICDVLKKEKLEVVEKGFFSSLADKFRKKSLRAEKETEEKKAVFYTLALNDITEAIKILQRRLGSLKAMKKISKDSSKKIIFVKSIINLLSHAVNQALTEKMGKVDGVDRVYKPKLNHDDTVRKIKLAVGFFFCIGIWAMAEGFNGAVTLFGSFSMASWIPLVIGLSFALLNAFIVFSFDLKEIAKQNGITPLDVKKINRLHEDEAQLIKDYFYLSQVLLEMEEKKKVSELTADQLA